MPCPECDHCQEAAKLAGKYKVGDLVVANHYGRIYLRIDEVHEDWVRSNYAFRANGSRIARQGYASGGGVHDGGEPWFDCYVQGSSVKRRLSQQQWDALATAGFPGALTGALKKANVPVDEPARDPPKDDAGTPPPSECATPSPSVWELLRRPWPMEDA